jgi:hypothetical protein
VAKGRKGDHADCIDLRKHRHRVNSSIDRPATQSSPPKPNRMTLLGDDVLGFAWSPDLNRCPYWSHGDPQARGEGREERCCRVLIEQLTFIQA